MTTLDKGEQIMNGLLLSQYQESPNLKEYYMAFISEMDYLFQSIEEVYHGRLLENAVGAQLDVIGEILQQSRSLEMGAAYFGFQGALGAESFGEVSSPTTGGVLKSVYQGNNAVEPVNDVIYRRVLTCKGMLLNSESVDLEIIYKAVTILLNRTLSKFIVTEPANMQVQLEVGVSEVSTEDNLLILYMARYFIPAGVTFTTILT